MVPVPTGQCGHAVSAGPNGPADFVGHAVPTDHAVSIGPNGPADSVGRIQSPLDPMALVNVSKNDLISILKLLSLHLQLI